MSVPANTTVTENAVGLREDVSELIKNISPTETPVLSASGTTDATQPLHQWQQDTLKTPNGNNARIEGDDAALEAHQETELLGNYTQISDKRFGVSGTYEVSGKYGRDSQLAYQAAKASRELKTDVDSAISGVKTIAANGAGATARVSASLEGWLLTNTDRGTGGTNPTRTNGIPSAVGTDGTIRKFVQTQLDSVIASGWENGAQMNLMVLGATQKAQFGGFDGVGNDASSANNVTRSDREGRTVFASADFYWSHLIGRLTVVTSRHIRRTAGTGGAEGSVAGEDRNVFLIDPEYLKTAYLRPWQQYDLAKTGDNIKRQMLVEWCLEVCNERAHGIVADVGTP